jgi:hypothetical protein
MPQHRSRQFVVSVDTELQAFWHQTYKFHSLQLHAQAEGTDTSKRRMGVSTATEDRETTRKCLPLPAIERPNVSSQPVAVKIEISWLTASWGVRKYVCIRGEEAPKELRRIHQECFHSFFWVTIHPKNIEPEKVEGRNWRWSWTRVHRFT